MSNTPSVADECDHRVVGMLATSLVTSNPMAIVPVGPSDGDSSPERPREATRKRPRAGQLPAEATKIHSLLNMNSLPRGQREGPQQRSRLVLRRRRLENWQKQELQEGGAEGLAEGLRAESERAVKASESKCYDVADWVIMFMLLVHLPRRGSTHLHIFLSYLALSIAHMRVLSDIFRTCLLW